RWLGLKFLPKEEQDALGLARTTLENGTQVKLVDPTGAKTAAPMTAEMKLQETPELSAPLASFDNQSDAPACENCGMIMVRAGSCYKCNNCGNTSGCGEEPSLGPLYQKHEPLSLSNLHKGPFLYQSL